MSGPALRFTETGSFLRNEFGDLVEKRSEKYNPAKEEIDLPCVELESLAQNTGQILYTFSAQSLHSIKNKFYAGDTLFGKLRPYLNKYFYANFDGVCTSEIWVLKAKLIDAKYLYQVVQTPRFKKVANESSGSKMPRSDWSLVSSEIFTYPSSKKEQKKIAEFLGAVDEKIRLLQSRHEQLTLYKKGVMQKIFAQDIRFKADDGSDFPDWRTIKLGDLGIFKSGVGFTEKEQGGKAGIPFYKVSDMNLNGNETVMTKANNYVTKSQIVQNKYSVFRGTSIIFAKVGAAIFLERKRVASEFLLDNNMMAFTPNETFLISFCVQLFTRIRLSKFAQVGALPSYNAGDLKTIKVEIPDLKEQKKIADFLSAIDDKIEAVSAKVENMQSFKKGLLQQMFV